MYWVQLCWSHESQFLITGSKHGRPVADDFILCGTSAAPPTTNSPSRVSISGQSSKTSKRRHGSLGLSHISSSVALQYDDGCNVYHVVLAISTKHPHFLSISISFGTTEGSIEDKPLKAARNHSIVTSRSSLPCPRLPATPLSLASPAHMRLCITSLRLWLTTAVSAAAEACRLLIDEISSLQQTDHNQFLTRIGEGLLARVWLTPPSGLFPDAR